MPCHHTLRGEFAPRVIVVLTEWPDFRTLDWVRMAEVVAELIVVETRNLLDADVLRRAGFDWTGVERNRLNGRSESRNRVNGLCHSDDSLREDSAAKPRR